MITTDINELMKLLEQAKLRGSTEVKLQLYDNWPDIEKEQTNPSRPISDYQVDTRFYNTIEFDGIIRNSEETDKLQAYAEGEVFVIKVSLSNAEALFRQLGLPNL